MKVALIFLGLLATTLPAAEKVDLLPSLVEAMQQHRTQNWAASNLGLEQAFGLADKLYTISLGKQASALVKDDRELDYQPLPTELAALHAIGMTNFLQLDQNENALVEARRADELMRNFRDNSLAPLPENSWTRYLCACAYEDAGMLSDAYIDYNLAAQGQATMAKATGLKEAQGLVGDKARLLRWRDGEDAARRLGEPAHLLQAQPLAKGEGQLVLLIYEGSVPDRFGKKSSLGIQIVEAPPLATPPWTGTVEVEGGQGAVPLELLWDVAMAQNIEQKARNLKEETRRVVRGTLKASAQIAIAIVAQGHTKNMGNEKAEQDDLRYWSGLPGRVYMARIRGQAGLKAARLIVQTGPDLPPARRIIRGLNIRSGRVGVVLKAFETPAPAL